MAQPEEDTRGSARKSLDEKIAREPQLPPPSLADESAGEPLEAHLARQARRPVAVRGIVEKGLVRPLDPAVKLAENARVIIIASEEQ